jgi:hypothetical protein
MKSFRALVVLTALLGATPIVACVASEGHEAPIAEISLELGSANLPLAKGQSVQLQATVATATGTSLYVVEYSSSAPNVASVTPAGIVTGLANGTSTITVKATLLDTGASAQATVTATVGGGATDSGAPIDAGSPGTTDSGAPGSCTTPLVVGMDTQVPANDPRPALNVPYVDPRYKLTLSRATAASQVTDRDIPAWVRHEYSRRQAFNVDSSRALMISSNGWVRLYDVKTDGTMAFKKTLGIAEPQEPNWHPTDPNKVWVFGSYGDGMKITTYDITNDQTAVYRDLGPKLKALFPTAARAWTKQEGRPSDDGRVFCLMVETASYGSLGLVAYDAVADKILGSMPTTSRPDHISTSPKGDYCVPSWTSSQGTRAYKTDFSSFTQLHTTSEHSDLAVTKSGEQVYVYTDYSPNPTNGGYVVMANLATGAKTNLFPLYGTNHSATAIHISGTSRAKPGYVTVGFYACTENYGSAACNPATQWFKDKVVAVELKATPKIYNLAHTRYGNGGYFAETQAVASPDLTKVLFVSTWGGTAENDVASYLLRIPSCALP